jgi:hypothetical protein
MKWPHHRNLRNRPPTSCKGRGPVRVRIRRAFITSGAEVLSSTQIYDWTHSRQRQSRRKKLREALATPGRPGIRVIAERFGVNPSTVQRISRPFDDASVAVA